MRHRKVCWCENLINAPKLLANQQKDGDSPVQSVATSFCEGSRNGLVEGLRHFIKVDNHCALDVGHLSVGTRSFAVRRPKFEEGVNQGMIEEMTLRGRSWLPESMYQCRSQSGGQVGDRPWLTLIGMLFAKQSAKERKATNGRICTSTSKKSVRLRE